MTVGLDATLELSLLEAGLVEIGLLCAGLLEIGLLWADLLEIGLIWVCLLELGLFEIGFKLGSAFTVLTSGVSASGVSASGARTITGALEITLGEASTVAGTDT